MSEEQDRPRTLVRATEIAAAEAGFSHPWNESSRVIGTRLSSLTGLKRAGVSLARVPPGKESFVYHSHEVEEEWIYILSGRGIAEIDGEEFEVGSGDFMGFATPSVAHHLRNPFDEDLCYLMGGEKRELEIADFPRLNRRMIRRGMQAEFYALDAAQKLDFGGE